jgi:hypothetical protein
MMAKFDANHTPEDFKLVVMPDSDNPDSPYVFVAMCTCGNDNCHFSTTVYQSDMTHIVYQSDMTHIRHDPAGCGCGMHNPDDRY